MNVWGAIVGGLVSGVAVSAFFAIRKRNTYLRQIERLREPDALNHTELARRTTALREEMVTFATDHTSELVERTALNLLSTEYGLTQDRIARAVDLGRRLGA